MRSITLLVALTLAATLSRTAAAQDTAAFYDEHCASCHTIGGGVQGGPDLKGVTGRRDRGWLVRFLLDPDAFASDPAVIQMIKDADGLAMGPTEGLTPAMAEALLDFIDQQSGTAPATAAAPFAPFTGDEAMRGRMLFMGEASLAERGPACIACHAAGDVAPLGGRLAVDLAGVDQRLGGPRGVTAWLKGTPTPMMHALYANARLSDQEARALAAFLETSTAPPDTGASIPPHVIGGVTIAILFIAAIGLAWSRRLSGVRRPLVEASAHSYPPTRGTAR